MAKQPSKKPTANNNTKSETTVTRIKASDSKPAAAKKTIATAKAVPTTASKAKKPVTAEPVEGTGKRRNPFRAMADYFKGAWYELRQVRWPDRKATWGMTGALLAFTGFFVALVLLLDALFKYVFQLIIG